MTKKDKVLEIVLDYEWHCTAHEFIHVRSSQIAAIFEVLENEGYIFEEDPNKRTNQYNTFHSWKKYCETCKEETEHRKLLKEPK